MTEKHQKQLRGFKLLSPERRKEIASKGGKRVSRNRTHMAEIGREGGLQVSSIPGHMASIGRIGGSKSKGKKKVQQ